MKAPDNEKISCAPLCIYGCPLCHQGWAERERPGMMARASADAVFALAFIHPMAITKNNPLDRLVERVVGFAPRGIIGFVPKQEALSTAVVLIFND